MRFSTRVFFHLKAEDPYMAVKQAARHAIQHFLDGAVTLEGVDTTLNGLFAPLEPGAKEVMVGFNVEAADMKAAKQIADRLYTHISRQLGEDFINLPKEEDRVAVEVEEPD